MKSERKGTITTETEWPVVRQGWTGVIPVIFGNRSSAKIFCLACRPGGASIEEMLSLRVDSGKSYDTKKKAVIKLLKEIEKAFLVKLIEIGDDKYQFQPVNSLVSRMNNPINTSLAQASLNAEIPTRKDVEKIIRSLGGESDEDVFKDAVAASFAKEGRTLKPNWWEITKKNLIEWSREG